MRECPTSIEIIDKDLIKISNYITQILRGNSNTYLVEKQKLDLPFVASRVRFVPYSQHPRTVCMRVEIYGCIWNRKYAIILILHLSLFSHLHTDLSSRVYNILM